MFFGNQDGSNRANVIVSGHASHRVMSDSQDVTAFIAPHVAAATYNGVETLEAIAAEIGMPPEDIVKVLMCDPTDPTPSCCTILEIVSFSLT